MTTKSNRAPSDHNSDASWWLLAALGAVGLGCAAIRLLADVFSLAGIAYTLGLGDGRQLWQPGLTAALTWVLLIEGLASAGILANHIDGRRHAAWVVAWALGHVRAGRWLVRALVWVAWTLRHAGERLASTSTRPDDGFEDFAVFQTVPISSALAEDDAFDEGAPASPAA